MLRMRFYIHKEKTGDFPVVWWLGIHLPMQGTWVQFLMGENPTCCGQLSTWSQCSPTREACALQLASSLCSLQEEKACMQ